MIRKNVASQTIYLPALLLTADGTAVTSGATLQVGKDGTEAGSAGTLTHVSGGVWKYTPTQAETNAAIVGLILSATNATTVAVSLVTTAADTSAVAFGASTSATSVGHATTIERSVDDNKAINIVWPSSGETLTGTKSIDNAGFVPVTGAFSFLRTETTGKHVYSLAYNAADRLAAEGQIRYIVTDGTETRSFNLRIVAKSGYSLATNAITATVIQDNAITANKIASNAITDAKINTGAITSAKFAAGAINAAAIASNAIEAAKINAGAITNAKFAAGAIDATAIASNAITDAKINTGAITSAKFAAGAINAASIAASALNGKGDWNVGKDGYALTAGTGLGNQGGTVGGIAGTIQTLDALDTAQDTQHSTTQNRLPADLVGGRMDASVGAMGANVITASALNADAATEIADALLSRSVSTVQSTAPEHSLATIILGILEWDIDGTNWVIYRTDGTTVHYTKTISSTPGANPITTVQ